MGDTPSLYEWAGGRPAIERMIDRFYDRLSNQPVWCCSARSVSTRARCCRYS
jgi:hypothetical protein